MLESLCYGLGATHSAVANQMFAIHIHVHVHTHTLEQFSYIINQIQENISLLKMENC